MKKLISIFAALAMVGALAAQKRKAPAKAPAKPAAVAAPAAPAAVTAPAPVVAAPAASGKGLGLSIEARGSWIQSHGTSTAKADGTDTATSNAFELSGSNGFGGGLTVGYDIAKNLAAVVSFDYRAISTREWKNTTTANAVSTIKQDTNTSVIGIGVRPSVAAFGGSFYAGMGFAMVLPYKNEATATLEMASMSSTAKLVQTDEWNLGLGVYGELGYNYAINDMLFVGVGIRGLVATSNNDGKTTTKTFSSTGVAGGTLINNLNGGAATTAGTDTTNYAKSYDPSAAVPARTTNAAFQSQGITDMTVSITVGARF